MGNGMNKVLPGLYVGNYRDSKDASQLERFEITHIVAIHDAARKLHSDKHYLCVIASDTPDQNLTQYFPLCNDFIHAARLRGGNVLIHWILRRKSSTCSATPPQSPRMLPPTPSITRSTSALSRRPRSGPAGLHSYTGSAPPSRSGSRHDVSELPPGVMNWQDRRVGSAPTTPMASPPSSPQHWPRRASTLLRKPSNT